MRLLVYVLLGFLCLCIPLIVYGLLEGAEMKDRLQEMGENLIKARVRAGLKQEALAELLDCTIVTLSRWENGHNAMKANDIIKVVELLGISADELLGVKRNGITGGECENVDLNNMVMGLEVRDRIIVEETVRAMVAAMKAK